MLHRLLFFFVIFSTTIVAMKDSPADIAVNAMRIAKSIPKNNQREICVAACDFLENSCRSKDTRNYIEKKVCLEAASAALYLALENKKASKKEVGWISKQKDRLSLEID